MLVFSSPRVPGSHYKVEADGKTAARMQVLINAELHSATVTGKMLGHDEDEPHHDPFNRC